MLRLGCEATPDGDQLVPSTFSAWVASVSTVAYTAAMVGLDEIE